jgi:hypothetical protein
MEKEIIAYKGFDKNMKCRGFQYAVGKTYTHNGPVKICESGYHACENPIDVYAYYDPGNSIFCEVRLSGKMERSKDDSKIAAEVLTIIRILSSSEFSKITAEYIYHNAKEKNITTGYHSSSSNTGYCSSSINTGGYSSSSNTGDYSSSINTGGYSSSSNTGDRSSSINTGDRSSSSNTGYRSSSSNTGDYSSSINTGDRSSSSNTGYRSSSINTGDRSSSSVEGKESIAIVTGQNSKASGALGCWIVLTERDEKYNIVSVKSAKVDGKKIKENVFYTLKRGRFVKS